MHLQRNLWAGGQEIYFCLGHFQSKAPAPFGGHFLTTSPHHHCLLLSSCKRVRGQRCLTAPEGSCSCAAAYGDRFKGEVCLLGYPGPQPPWRAGARAVSRVQPWQGLNVSWEDKQRHRSFLSRAWATIRNPWPAFFLSTFSGWEGELCSFLLQHIMTLRSLYPQRALCQSLQQSATSSPAMEGLVCTQCVKLSQWKKVFL